MQRMAAAISPEPGEQLDTSGNKLTAGSSGLLQAVPKKLVGLEDLWVQLIKLFLQIAKYLFVGQWKDILRYPFFDVWKPA
ncbi:MAG: hypothetical protein KAR47_18555 [Planctomycetes bacterium]|nr:hypothetical protein [Planctomycetota bacterium]